MASRDCYEEEESDEEEEFVELPWLVKIELERRRDSMEASSEPPSLLAVQALRQHFESGQAEPYCHGSFISLMWKLGATPRSDDILVKEVQHNAWYLGPTGEDTEEWWAARIQDHEAEVRLLRYGEFIESQKAKGLVLEPDYDFVDYHADRASDFHQTSYDEADRNGSDTKCKSSNDIDDTDLSKEQLEALANSFSAGFYFYVNQDKVYTGVGQGVQQHGSVPNANGGLRIVSLSMSIDVIIEQCGELQRRYWEQECPLPVNFREHSRVPLGKSSGNNKKKKNRQRKQNAQGRDHATIVTGHIRVIFSTLEEHCVLPSAASARILSAIAQMLTNATANDPEIARAMTKEAGEATLRLRDHCLECAMEADADESRPNWAADDWWRAFLFLTKLLGDTIASLTGVGVLNPFEDHLTPDVSLATGFFEASVAPSLLKSVASPFAAERRPSLNALDRAVMGVPRQNSIRLVKDKKTWNLLVAACTHSESIMSGPRAQERENRTVSPAASEATRLLTNLCGRGMTMDSSTGSLTGVAPGALARKMVERGVVPLLVALSRSPIDRVSSAALCGLGQISRIKDCRLVLFQNGGLELVRDMLASMDGQKVSNTMLLGVHLLWDEEWREPLMSIKPGIETTAVKWAAHCMKCIRELAEKTRVEHQRQCDEHMGEFCRKFRLGDDNPEEKEKLELQLEEDGARLENAVKWTELETEKLGGADANNTLCRCLLLLSTLMHHPDGRERILNANALALAAACIDVPAEGTYSTAATLLKNFDAGRPLLPGMFQDQDHLLRSLISRINKFADIGQHSQQSVVFMLVLSHIYVQPEWGKHFEALAESDPEAKFTIENMLPSMSKNFAAWAPDYRSRPTTSRTVSGRHREKCTDFTGKLRQCENCEKMEGKKGEFSSCAKCQVARYCSRDCQREDWKRHKKECASLAEPKK